ncbi:MAG: glycosyltransferase family 4 protein, partial [Aminivibrio sp.]
MKILQILPEMHEGGVERHVLWLSNELAAMGHDVRVVSAGGKLESKLDGVRAMRLSVHLKNLFTALYSAALLARAAKREKVDIIHAHSRVPAWISWWASALSGVPWIITCHAFYSKNAGLIPYKKARTLICVSEAVRTFFHDLFPETETKVVYNGLPQSPHRWNEPKEGPVKFLFVGRLTRKKGILALIEAFSKVNPGNWVLDIIGDGPLYDQIKEMIFAYGLENRVKLHGFCDVPEEWMAKCSCFLFPSLEEGMGLTLMRAVQMRVPVIASDLPAVRELSLSHQALIVPDDVGEWAIAINRFLKSGEGTAVFNVKKIPS